MAKNVARARASKPAGGEAVSGSQMPLWSRKVSRRSIPVVVVVNWATALFFFIFFALGMFGWFGSEPFQWFFLCLSMAAVAVGFGIISKWGGERLSF